MGTLALIEVIDRDGSVRHAHKVGGWPMRAGRAMDNDLLLDDPHVAPHHFFVDANEDGVFVAVADTVNGIQVEGQHLNAGERWQAGDVPFTVTAGHMQLRFRLAEHALEPEMTLKRKRTFGHSRALIAWLVLLNFLAATFTVYLDSDADSFVREAARSLMAVGVVALAWCGGWTLLSKLFTRRGHFMWHLRVMLTALLVWEVVNVVASLLAFSLSWPWLASYAFIAGYAVLAAALHLHMQAVELHRPVIVRAFALGAFVVGIGLNMWSNWQRTERLGDDLYLTALFPPALRLATPAGSAAFVDRLAPLQNLLDEKARKDSDDDEHGDDEE